MKEKHMLRFVSISILLAFTLVYGCKKHDLSKIAGMSMNQNAAVPIGYGDFDIHDLFKNIDDKVVMNPLGEMSLVYLSQLDTIKADEIIQLADVSQIMDFVPPTLGVAATGSFGGVLSSTIVKNFDYAIPGGVELHTVNFQSGAIVLALSTTLQHDITFQITMTDMLSSSTPIVRTLNVAYTGTVPQIASVTVPLTDVLADFTAGGTTVNRLRVSVDATITGTGQPIVGDESLNLTMSLNTMKYANIIGYFGSEVLSDITDSILVKIFENPIGSITFLNPKLTFTVDNSFGVPVDINFTNFSSINSVTGASVPLAGFPPVLSLNVPTIMGSIASTSIEFNSTNTTNITTIVDAVPKYVKFTVGATTNPGGSVPPLNFIESTSMMVMKSRLELPLDGYASGISASDTSDFSLGQNTNNIESIMFRLYTNNGFPIDFTGQATFVDANYLPIFSLFPTPEKIVSAASVDGAGKVSSPTSKTTDIIMDSEKIPLLANAKYVIISGFAGTTLPLNTEVIFYDSYRIAIKLGMQVQLKGNL